MINPVYIVLVQHVSLHKYFSINCKHYHQQVCFSLLVLQGPCGLEETENQLFKKSILWLVVEQTQWGNGL